MKHQSANRIGHAVPAGLHGPDEVSRGTLAVLRTAPRHDGRERRVLRPPVLEVFRHIDLAAGVVVATVLFGLSQFGQVARLGELTVFAFSLTDVLVIVAASAAWPACYAAMGLYDARRVHGVLDETVGLIVASAVALLASVVILPRGAVGAQVLMLVWAAALLTAIGARWLLRRMRRPPAPLAVLIVGSGPRAARLARELEQESGVPRRVAGFVDDPHEAIGGVPRRDLLGGLSNLDRVLLETQADEVFVALPLQSRSAEATRVVSQCARMGVACRFLADMPEAGAASRGSMRRATLRLEGSPTPEQWPLGKRALDVVSALAGLAVLSPLLLIIAAAVKLTSRGPVLFTQARYGYNRRLFRMYKFRTMRADAEDLLPQLEALNEAAGPLFKMREDPRITRVGRFLRRWSLDELPQLLNILRGDMTLVGPRPLTPRDVLGFTEPEWLRRFAALPGLTGLWQVTSREAHDFNACIAQDLEYIDRWSPRLDFEILARTVPTVLRGDGSV